MESAAVRIPRLRSTKRVVLRPFAGPGIRIARSRLPVPVRTLVARRVALPYLGAVDREFVREVRHGRFAGSTTDLLQALVYLFGVWEPVLTELLHRHLAPGDTFVDVGANSGWFTTIGAACVGPTGRVVAVEASPTLARALRAQVELNELSNVTIVEAAAADAPGILHVDPGPAHHTGLTRVRSTGEGVEVPADTLPELVGSEVLRAARLVKIDVEGAEYAVIRGLAPALADLRADAEIIVEVGPERAAEGGDLSALFATFSTAGFHPYLLPNDYGTSAYVDPQIPERLLRLDPATVVDEVDVVFSRTDADSIPL